MGTRNSYSIIYRFNHIRQNSWIGWLLRLTFSALILTFLFSRIDFYNVLNTLSQMNIRLLGLIFVLFFVFRVIWAFQMSVGLKLVGLHFTLFDLVKINLISTFYSLVVPGNLMAGGAASWYKLSRPTGRGAEALALLIYFRLINTLTLLGIGLVGAWFDPHLATVSFRIVVGTLLGGVILLLLPFFSPAATSLIERLGQPLLRRLHFSDPMQAIGQRIWQALIAFQALKKRFIVLILALSILYHFVGILIHYLFALAVNIDLSIFVIGWMRSFLGIIQMVPISLAGLGLREGSLVLLLNDYNIPAAQALSFALALFSGGVIVGTIGGILEGWDLVWGRHKAGRSPLNREADATLETST